MSKKAREIYNDIDGKFIQLEENDNYTLNIFKEGDHDNNKQFHYYCKILE